MQFPIDFTSSEFDRIPVRSEEHDPISHYLVTEKRVILCRRFEFLMLVVCWVNNAPWRFRSDNAIFRGERTDRIKSISTRRKKTKNIFILSPFYSPFIDSSLFDCLFVASQHTPRSRFVIRKRRSRINLYVPFRFIQEIIQPTRKVFS